LKAAGDAMNISEESWKKIDAVYDYLTDRFPDQEVSVKVMGRYVYFNVGAGALGVEIPAIALGTTKGLLDIVSEWKTAKWKDEEDRELPKEAWGDETSAQKYLRELAEYERRHKARLLKVAENERERQRLLKEMEAVPKVPMPQDNPHWFTPPPYESRWFE